MIKLNRSDLVCLAAVLVHGAVVAYLYADLPDPVPTHWNGAGEIDGYTPKPLGAWLGPMVTAALFVVFKIVPAISPRGFRMESFGHVVDILKVAVVLFMAVVGIAAILAARNTGFDPGRIILPGVGVLFIVIGNYMGKLRKNFFIGIRTPWTLASDEVWARTHRLGGWMFVLAGVLLLITGIAGWPVAPFLIAAALIAALVPVVYSFIAYRKLEGLGPEDG